MNNELQRVCKDAVVAYFVVQLQLLFGRTNKKHEKPMSRSLLTRGTLTRGLPVDCSVSWRVYAPNITPDNTQYLTRYQCLEVNLTLS